MLIQLQSLACVPHDAFVLIVIDVKTFNVLTLMGTPISTVTAHEASILLLLSAELSRDAQHIFSKAKVIRTREWDIESHPDGDILYYKYATVLSERLQIEEYGNLIEWLKDRVSKAADPQCDIDFKIATCQHIDNLIGDLDFVKENVNDRKALVIDYHASGISAEMRRILDNWDNIFIELPF